MKIEAQFDSIEEMVSFANKLASGVKPEVLSKKQKMKEEEKAVTGEEVKETQPNNQIADELPIKEDTADELPKAEGEIVYTLEQVRAKLTELSRTGKAKAVKQLLNNLGADNVSSLNPSKYTEAMEKAGIL
jgi:hypothetical protein